MGFPPRGQAVPPAIIGPGRDRCQLGNSSVRARTNAKLELSAWSGNCFGHGAATGRRRCGPFPQKFPKFPMFAAQQHLP